MRGYSKGNSKLRLLFVTILFTVVWTLMACATGLKGVLAIDENGCVFSNQGKCLSFTDAGDMPEITNQIINFISFHALVGFGVGFLGGILATLAPERNALKGGFIDPNR